MFISPTATTFVLTSLQGLVGRLARFSSRGIEPIEGVEMMKEFRSVDDAVSLTSGPGKLTQALKITSALNGVDMTNAGSELHIELGSRPVRVIATPG